MTFYVAQNIGNGYGDHCRILQNEGFYEYTVQFGTMHTAFTHLPHLDQHVTSMDDAVREANRWLSQRYTERLAAYRKATGLACMPNPDIERQVLARIESERQARNAHWR